eukprot:16099252-Heterocapsa_arctica.AAC.1
MSAVQPDDAVSSHALLSGSTGQSGTSHYNFNGKNGRQHTQKPGGSPPGAAEEEVTTPYLQLQPDWGAVHLTKMPAGAMHEKSGNSNCVDVTTALDSRLGDNNDRQRRNNTQTLSP